MKKFIIRNRLILLSACLVLITASVWFHIARKKLCEEILNNEIQIASHLCYALKGSIISEMGRGNCGIDNSQLTNILESIKQEVGLKSISIYRDGKCVNGDLLTEELNSFIHEKQDIKTTKEVIYFKQQIKIEPRKGRLSDDFVCKCVMPSSTYKADQKQSRKNLRSHTITLILGLEPDSYFAQISSKNGALSFQLCLVLLLISSLFFALIRSHEHRELKLQLQQLELNQSRLEELQFIAAGVAHETKNPLGIIRAIAQSMIRKKNVSQEIIQMSEQIIDEADVTSERLSDFLHFAKMRQPECSWFNLKSFCEHRTSIFAPDMEEHGIHFSYETVDKVIYTDESFLSQIIVNLMTNAIKACKDGDQIKLKITPDFILVEDSGCGMNEEQLQNVFKPYHQSRNGGHGIGLCMVKQLVDALGMKISIESELCIGTRVFITQLMCQEDTK